jgi:hypothetical protein
MVYYLLAKSCRAVELCVFCVFHANSPLILRMRLKSHNVLTHLTNLCKWAVSL